MALSPKILFQCPSQITADDMRRLATTFREQDARVQAGSLSASEWMVGLSSALGQAHSKNVTAFETFIPEQRISQAVDRAVDRLLNRQSPGTVKAIGQLDGTRSAPTHRIATRGQTQDLAEGAARKLFADPTTQAVAMELSLEFPEDVSASTTQFLGNTLKRLQYRKRLRTPEAVQAIAWVRLYRRLAVQYRRGFEENFLEEREIEGVYRKAALALVATKSPPDCGKASAGTGNGHPTLTIDANPNCGSPSDLPR